MWCIRVLSGKMAGEIFNLKSGSNKIGRAPDCDVTIANPGISKVHAQIDVLGNKLVITDLNSSNGTFVNGIQIRTQNIGEGDKISIYDTMFELLPADSNILPMRPGQENTGEVYEQAMQVYQGNAAPDLHAQPNSEQPQAQPQTQSSPQNAFEYVSHYFENVVMPGIYRLTEWMEFRVVLIVFCIINVLAATVLSTIPLTQILKEGIEERSRDRALSLAKALAVSNQSAIQQGLFMGVNTHMVDNEPGVDEKYVIDNEGRIIAPHSLAQQIPDEPFVHEARRYGKAAVKQLSSSKIGALVPIIGRNSQTGLEAPVAHAVIIYNMGRYAIDSERTFSLFVQSLFIALLVGGVVFFFLYRVVLHAVTQVNSQISNSLRTGEGQIQLKYQFPELQEMIANINSALSRVDDQPGEAPGDTRETGFKIHQILSNAIPIQECVCR